MKTITFIALVLMSNFAIAQIDTTIIGKVSKGTLTMINKSVDKYITTEVTEILNKESIITKIKKIEYDSIRMSDEIEMMDKIIDNEILRLKELWSSFNKNNRLLARLRKIKI